MFEPTARAMFRMLLVLLAGEMLAAWGFMSMGGDTFLADNFKPTAVSGTNIT